MERALQVLNDLEAAGTLTRYAIGGAVGAIFYMEPFLTFDLDVFVLLPEAAGGLLTLGPVYAALRDLGCLEDGECIVIAGIPVRFLPAFNPLLEEALREARDTLYEQTPTRVLRPEHLLAIMLQTGRPKDRQRFVAFLAEASIDDLSLHAILQRHDLETLWNQWKM